MLGRDGDSVLRIALDLEVSRKRKRSGPKKTWKKWKSKNKENWFKDKGCPKLSNVERWNAKNYAKNGVNPAICTGGTKPNKN